MTEAERQLLLKVAAVVARQFCIFGPGDRNDGMAIFELIEAVKATPPSSVTAAEKDKP